jgi:hypothetical protein
MLAEYTKRREWLLNALNEITGLRCPQPEGAFYAFPDVRGCLGGKLKTSAGFCERALREGTHSRHLTAQASGRWIYSYFLRHLAGSFAGGRGED